MMIAFETTGLYYCYPFVLISDKGYSTENCPEARIQEDGHYDPRCRPWYKQAKK